VVGNAEEQIGEPVAVFQVDKGFPEYFSLPALNPAVVTFSTRYLELIADLRGILGGSVSQGFIGIVSERVMMRIIAELSLRHGDPAHACYLFVKSLGNGLISVAPTPDIMDLVPERADERFMTVWFQAMLHELGHIHSEKSSLRIFPIIPPGLDELVEAVVKAIKGRKEARKALRLIRSTRGHSLDRQVLLRELDADRFSVQALFASMVEVLAAERRPQEFSSSRLAMEILDMFAVHNFMNGCARLARECTDFSFTEDPWRRFALQVRLNVLRDLLNRLIVIHWKDTLDPAEIVAKLDEFADWFNGDLHMARINALDNAQVKVSKECLLPATQDLGTMNWLAMRMAEIPEISPRVEIGRFCVLAKSLGIEHPDLDLLKAMYAEPSKARITLRESRKTFRILRIQDSGQPVVLDSGDVVVAFVFLTDDMALTLMRKFQRWIDLPLRVVTIESPTEHDVTVMLHQGLNVPGYIRLQTVFEGSPAFQQRVNELEDGVPGGSGRPGFRVLLSAGSSRTGRAPAIAGRGMPGPDPSWLRLVRIIRVLDEPS
jgi:hypothetical protein